jgi:signal transduction histidine kinase
MKRRRWVCSELLRFAVVAALALTALLAAAAQDPLITLDSAAFMLTDATQPPPDTAPWQPVGLPDDWAASRPNARGAGWYRLRLELPRAPTLPQALYTPVLRADGQAWINGALAGRSDATGAGAAVRWPQYFVVAPSLLRAGANVVHVRVVAPRAGQAGLAVLSFGVDSAVRPAFERRLLWTVIGVQFDMVLATLFGVISLALWMRRPKDRIYLWFGLSALCWVAFVGWRVVRVPPLPPEWWSATIYFAAYGKLLFMSLFALDYAGWQVPRVRRVLWAWCAVSAVIICLTQVLGLNVAPLQTGLRSLWIPMAVLYPLVFVAAAWRRPSTQNVLVALTASIHPVVHIYVHFAGLPIDAIDLRPHDFIPMQLIVGWILIDRFVRALNEAETLNAELEQRVTGKHAELQSNYEAMHRMARQAAIGEERHRIMSDMHDGIGGQLMSTLNLVEQGRASGTEVADALRECIDDLRLAIDSLEPTDDELLPVLGNLRYRLEGRLKQHGIELDWQVGEVPKLACLTPQNVLHILRILQEAFTNVLKHAQASRICVDTGVEEGRIAIRISDDGRGFDGRGYGRGLPNMHERARKIGGELHIAPSAMGTTLSLMLPLA